MANSLLFGQCSAYVLAIFFASFVLVPLAQNGNDFKGRCLLYTRGSWQRPNGTQLARQRLPPPPTASLIMRKRSEDTEPTEQPEQKQQDRDDYHVDYFIDGVAEAKAGGVRPFARALPPLTSQAEWDTGEASFVVAVWGAPSACQFATFTGIVSLLLAAVQAWRTIFYQCKGHDDTLFAAFINLVGSGLVAMMTFVASTVVSAGFNVWCNSIAIPGDKPDSCEEAQEMNLNMDVITTSFYTHFGVIQFGLWCAWLTWVALAGLAFAKVYRSHRQSDLLHSLVREKELLMSRAVTRGGAGPTLPERHLAAQAGDKQPSVFI
ncbi:transmembrane protein 179 [Petromyzon marinus]|uniref:transmembrane protein 179 n=1 Tax=Petromyzon marinus TaxID=7757 RepID=UPI003F724515